MTDIELEDGEAYYFQDDDDDDENVDPDRDFSYIDKKIENILGQDQKDFMSGVSAESLGARYGGYGSFLPMQQRSPPILSNQRSQSLVSSKSPQDLPSECFNQNPANASNQTLPARSLPASGDQNLEAMSDTGVSSMNNQSKIQSSEEPASNLPKKKLMLRPEKNTLKFRVKMASESISNLDKIAIYSGLGLDMSPTSSPEGSPSENDGTSTQEANLDSPSFIIKIMTTVPLPSNELLSPLHDSLINLKGTENSVGTRVPEIGETFPVNTVTESKYLKGKKEARKEKKPKVRDASKVKKSKLKEVTEETLLKQDLKSEEQVKDACDYPANIVALSATKREENGTLSAKEIASNAAINAFATYSEEKERTSLMNKKTGSKPLNVTDKKTEAVNLCEDIDNPMKQIHSARHKTKEEPGSIRKHDAVEDDMHSTALKGKIEKDKNFTFILKSDTSTEKRDEIGWREDEVNKTCKQRSNLKGKVKEEFHDLEHPKDRHSNLFPKGESTTDKRNEGRRENEPNKFLKQQRMVKDKVKEEDFNSSCPTDAGVYRKENGVVDKKLKDEEACFLLQKDEEVGKYDNVSEDKKYGNVGTLEPSKQKSHSREMTLSQTEQELHSERDFVVKKKPKGTGSQIGGFCTAEPPRGNSIDGPSAANNEEVVSKNNIPSKSKKGDSDLPRETRNSIEVGDKRNSRKKGKDVNSKDFIMRVPEQEASAFTAKLKDKSSSYKPSLAPNSGSIVGDLAGGNCMTEKVGDAPQIETVQLVNEHWVECEKCHKWRLLPLGISSDDLTEKEWTCRMITWLPGMNKCSFTEDETASAVRAMYAPVVPAQLQNNQPPYLDANASVNASADAQNVNPPNQGTGVIALPSVGRKKNLVKTDIDAAQQSGFQDLHISVKKDQQHSGEIKNLKNLKKHPRESFFPRNSGDGKPLKFEKKRVADVEAYGFPKKIKTVHQQPVEDYNPGAMQVPQDLTKGSLNYPLARAKDRSQRYTTSMDEEIYDVSGKKRKLKDKQHHVATPSGKGGNSVKDGDIVHSGIEHRKAKKSKSSNFQARESSADKQHQRTHSGDPKFSLGGAGDNGLHQVGRSVDMDHYRGDSISQKTSGGKKSSELALDLGLSDNATSSSSKVSCKVRAKAQGVRSSPVASISSSPKKVLKADPDKGANKKFASHNEQRLKSGAVRSAIEFAPHNEGLRDRKSKLSRNSIVSDAADEDHYGKKVAPGRQSSSHAINSNPILEDCKDAGGKLDPLYEGSTSLQILATENETTKSLIKLPFDGSNSNRGKLRVSKIDSEKEVSSNSHGVPDFGGGGGSIGGGVDNVNRKPSRQIVIGHSSLRQDHHTGHVSNDIEASSSRKKDYIHGAAKTALREAKDLKHSASRLKIAGSGLESTGIFFQAALKFLHGASLLEPGNNENRSGEMAPNEVYATTAKLCEYCAKEYERCNDMASAALAFKCMEIAYMRVVYCNDLAASRDCKELKKAVTAAPQVDSPSSSASDIDNLNQATIDTVKDGHSTMDHRSHIVSAGNRPNFIRLLDFTHDINLAMEASRSAQSAFAAAMPVFEQAANEEGISSIKSVLDFSFHDVDGLLHLVRLAMETIKS